MEKRLRILLSNDDGFDADGITSLAEVLSEVADVHIAAPLDNHSGASSSITLGELEIIKDDEGIHSVGGTPVDCVQLALHTDGLLPWKPDLTVSGINHGSNIGDSCIHSGTVAAAGESVQAGIPAIAFSFATENFPTCDFSSCAKVAKDMFELFAPQILEHPNMMLNINIPDMPYDEIKGPKLCQLGIRNALRNKHRIDKGKNPNIQKYFLYDYASTQQDDSLDHVALEQGYISVTPLQFNLSDTHHMELVKKWLN